MTEQEQELRDLYRRLKGLQVDVTRLFRRMPWEASPGNAMGLGVGDPQLTATWTTQTTPEPGCSKRLWASCDDYATYRISWAQALPYIHPQNNSSGVDTSQAGSFVFSIPNILANSENPWNCQTDGDILDAEYFHAYVDKYEGRVGWAATALGCQANSFIDIDAVVVPYVWGVFYGFYAGFLAIVKNYLYLDSESLPVVLQGTRYCFGISDDGEGFTFNDIRYPWGLNPAQSTTRVFIEDSEFDPAALSINETRRLDVRSATPLPVPPGTATYVTLTRIS